MYAFVDGTNLVLKVKYQQILERHPVVNFL